METINSGYYIIGIGMGKFSKNLDIFVSKPSHRPVFDRFQYAKTEGEGLGDLVMCMVI